MTKTEEAFLKAARELAADENNDSGLRRDAIYAIENYCNPMRKEPHDAQYYITQGLAG